MEEQAVEAGGGPSVRGIQYHARGEQVMNNRQLARRSLHIMRCYSRLELGCIVMVPLDGEHDGGGSVDADKASESAPPVQRTLSRCRVRP
eukprot:46858-Eustigmatos_ZCMA.PRE.1